ncbi:hypothetical protein VTN77DRAFT_1389 [Rasamsonia byssochlamydoides]|uniref:uncharacterized protein n=1 Tax=Rasamsonia byssochlamydoides TaxID=89139 RepID=UPI003743C0DD
MGLAILQQRTGPPTAIKDVASHASATLLNDLPDVLDPNALPPYAQYRWQSPTSPPRNIFTHQAIAQPSRKANDRRAWATAVRIANMTAGGTGIPSVGQVAVDFPSEEERTATVPKEHTSPPSKAARPSHGTVLRSPGPNSSVSNAFGEESVPPSS